MALKDFFSFGKSTDDKSIKESGIGWVNSGGSFFSKMDSSTQDVENQKMYMNAYLKFPIVASAIDQTAEQVVQEFYFEGSEKKTAQNWADKVNLGQQLHVTAKHMLINGGCWVEFPKRDEWKFVDPTTMNIIRKKNGDIVAHYQEIQGQVRAIWGTIPKDSVGLNIPPDVKKAPIEKIVYFPFNRLAGEKYGTSLLHSIIPLLMVKEQVENDLKHIVGRYAAPLIHVKVGDENHMPSQSTIDDINSKLEDIHSESEYVTNHLVDMNVIGFEGKGFSTEGIVDHLDKNIMRGLQVMPEQSNGTGDAETNLRIVGRHIKSIQRQLRIVFEDEVLHKILRLSAQTKLVFQHAEEREQEMWFDQLRGLVTDGIITPQKANDLLPPKFHEKLPDPMEMMMNPATGAGVRSQNQNQTPFQKGADAVKDNPNDPTKTQLPDDRRRVKSDRASTSKPEK